MHRIIKTSLTRIAGLEEFAVQALPREQWEWNDYVVAEVTEPTPLSSMIELPNGRGVRVGTWDQIMGAFSTRYATLEATGSWKDIGDDMRMEAMTAAGMLGVLTSKSPYFPGTIKLRYVGHVMVNGVKQNMRDFVPEQTGPDFDTPVLMIVGSSMSAGKTSSARIIIRELKSMGLKVIGAKLTGAGRYRDILAMSDAGADAIYDFVDVGLSSTVCPPEMYRERIVKLLSRIQTQNADVVVVEAGASPLEPYNGDTITEMLADQIKMTVLCASDPYSVVGIMDAFGREPDLVAGISCNTEAGISLINKLTGVPAMRLMGRKNYPELDEILADRFLNGQMSCPTDQATN